MGKAFALNVFAMVCVRITVFYLLTGILFPVNAVMGLTGDFLVSTDPSHAEQNNPSVAVGLDGKFMVVWSDLRNGNSDLYGQAFDSGAVTSGYNTLINNDGQGAWQFDPDLSADWYGNYYIVWKDYRNNSYPFDPDIFYQKFDSLGPVGDNINITVELPDSSHQSPAVAAAGWGKTVVTWTDLRNRNWDVFVQSLDSARQLLGPNKKVNDDLVLAPQHEPAVALSSKGWFVVSWYDGRNGNDDIYVQKFDSAGNAVGSNLKVNDDNDNSKQKFPSIAIGGNDVIYVVWTDWRRGTYPADPDVFGQRLDSSLNRLGSNFIINRDNTYTAQREPRVAADRMGNACIVWSDSSSGEWNAMGQMIDYNGQLRDNNFKVNLDSAGTQHFPDVALDGYFLYLVWADNRNGDFDIYCRLHRYNDPALQPIPSRAEFSKDKSDSDPDSLKIILQNAGYGELNYNLNVEDDWITLSKTSGTTPDSFYIGVNSGSLDYGSHMGHVRLIDLNHGDSSSLFPVLLTITGPLLDIEPDSLAFRALMEVGPPALQNIMIGNSGSGSLNWSLTKTSDWITVNNTAGQAGDLVRIGCDISSLIKGEYEGHIIVSDAGALNTPESLQVTLSLHSNLAYLSADVDSVFKDIIWGRNASDSVRILNLGGAPSDWRSRSNASWFNFLPDSGGDNDFIFIDFATADLPLGRYTDNLVIDDSAAFNNPFLLPIIANIVIGDTVFIPPSQIHLGEEFQIPLYLRLNNEINRGYIELRYDQTFVSVDSALLPMGDLDGRVSTTIDTYSATLSVEVSPDSTSTPIGMGEHHLGDLFLTANDSLSGQTSLIALPGDSLFLESRTGLIYRPILESHEIEITSPTYVEDRGSNQNPAIYSLGQNYPNPFNNQTEIAFNMARSGLAKLEVYNILGQRVATIIDNYLSAGLHTVVWNGRTNSGEETASGIYFYKCAAPGFNAVRKMVYLK